MQGLKESVSVKNLIKIATSQGEILRENINFDYRFCPLNMPFFWAEFKLKFLALIPLKMKL